ncbi:MAG: hypothetical protein ABR499_13525 [Gemmatimonadaceae bacterium]
MTRVARVLRDRWNAFFFEGYSAESLGLLRIALGLAVIPFFAHQYQSLLALDPHGPGFYYIEPIWYFEALGIDHHAPLVTYLVFGVLLVCAVTMSLGVFTGTSIVLVMLAVVYLKGVRDSMSGDVHHREIIPFHVLALLALSAAGSVYSLSGAPGKVRRRIAAWEASWPIKAMQLYACSFYFWSGVAKLRVSGLDWFADGSRLQEILLFRSVRYGFSDSGQPSDNPLAQYLAYHPNVLLPLSVATIVMEVGFPLLLLVRSARWRLVLLVGVAAFHVANFVLLNVQFLLLPLFFVIFFDLRRPWVMTRVYARRRAWLARPRAAAQATS